MALALVCVGLLLFFIHHISQAISVNHIVDRIAEETEVMIDELMPGPRRLNRLKHAEPLTPNRANRPFRAMIPATSLH